MNSDTITTEDVVSKRLVATKTNKCLISVDMEMVGMLVEVDKECHYCIHSAHWIEGGGVFPEPDNAQAH